MTAILAFIQAHPYFTAGAVTFVTQYVWSAFIGALEAPTATSSAQYRFWFKFLNGLAANIARARNTSIESSPNFQAAVAIQTSQGGLNVPKV